MSSTRTCPACGAPISPDASECRYCGEKLTVNQSQYQDSQDRQYETQKSQQYTPPYAPEYAPPQSSIYDSYNEDIHKTRKKSKIVAGILAILFGGYGLHKFYLGKVRVGILYLLFIWTGIPIIAGIIEGIIYLTSSDEKFYTKYVMR